MIFYLIEALAFVVLTVLAIVGAYIFCQFAAMFFKNLMEQRKNRNKRRKTKDIDNR